MSDAVEAESPEFLTVRELAELLRIKERKVYDLAASGEVPCARVTGKLLFSKDAIRAWIAGASSHRASAERPAIFLGSSDPLLEWALRQSRCGLATLFDGSLDGLDRFAAGEGIAAGLHIPDLPSGDWNVPSVAARDLPDAVLVEWARRDRGLVLRQDDASSIRSIGDLAGRRVVPRQPESGSDLLFRHLMTDAGLSPEEVFFGGTARSESDAVTDVAAGSADAAFGLRSLAEHHRLVFVPLAEERFDILVDRRAWFEAPMQRFFTFCRSSEFRAHAAATPGYRLDDFMEVRWNA